MQLFENYIESLESYRIQHIAKGTNLYNIFQIAFLSLWSGMGNQQMNV